MTDDSYWIELNGTEQDGRIDFQEFAAMMKKGDGGEGGRTVRGNLNFNFAEALGVKDSSSPSAASST